MNLSIHSRECIQSVRGARSLPTRSIFKMPTTLSGRTEGYLLKCSGGKKVKKEGSGSRLGMRRASFGNALSKWERRFFVITTNNVLQYYKKAQDAATGKSPSGELQLMGGLVSVEGLATDKSTSFSFRFTLETRERTMSLRAETDVERSGWIQRLLECGAQYHPLSSHLAAHAVQAQAPAAEAPPPPPIAAAQVRTNAGSTSTYVSVPVGARAGQRFQVQVPTVRAQQQRMHNLHACILLAHTAFSLFPSAGRALCCDRARRRRRAD